MIKFIVAALWLTAVTIGTVFYSFQSSQGKAIDAASVAPSLLGGLDYVKTDVLSVPIIKGPTVDGYFLSRLVYTVEPAKLKKLNVPMQALLTDELYTFLYGNKSIDVTGEHFDVDALRNGVRDAVNKRVGDTLVHDVMIEQIDYLTKSEIRDNTIRRRQNTAEAAAKSVKPEATPAARH